MIIFGGKASNIGNFDIPNSNCEYCEQGNTQRVSVFGKYAHVFWIPFFQLAKKQLQNVLIVKEQLSKKNSHHN